MVVDVDVDDVEVAHQYKEGNSGVKEKDKEKEQNLFDTALEFYEVSQEFWIKGNTERAINALDQSYLHILRVNTENNMELIQPVEDLRFMISKRIQEIYASRYTAVNGSHEAIPLIMNRDVEEEIKKFQGVERDFFVESYKRSGRYMEGIVNALKEAGLPEELSWLPLIESGFKVKALSRARALGLWQFIPSTGYKFGLQRGVWIDERLDPEKSTKAAIAYLKELHHIFGDWTTVLAAYNCGEERVLQVIRGQKINYLDNFWDLYQRLPLETARYVPRFLATLHILKDPARYGIPLDEIEKPISYELVTIEKQVHLRSVAKELGISLEELTTLNPELRYKVTPNSPYPLKLPQGMGKVLLAQLDEIPKWMAQLDEIPKWSPPQKSYTYHQVRKGETLFFLAQKYRTSITDIVKANNIHKDLIRVGQRLKVPLKRREGEKIMASKIIASNLKPSPDRIYCVRKGDSLWRIAQRFNTSMERLREINDLESSHLYVGQVLKR
ncbi:MAG: LysM peptidoglycan-binding domain-containing protein [Nitrospinae bacterium]|nr:LysM peptidoglycan-binding domain-containing protein [Nitrospinota bacterium]